MEIKTAEEHFAALGYQLPPAPKPLGVYKPYLIDGKHLYLSGHGPVQSDGTLIIRPCRQRYGFRKGKLAARQVGLTMSRPYARILVA